MLNNKKPHAHIYLVLEDQITFQANRFRWNGARLMPRPNYCRASVNSFLLLRRSKFVHLINKIRRERLAFTLRDHDFDISCAIMFLYLGDGVL